MTTALSDIQQAAPTPLMNSEDADIALAKKVLTQEIAGIQALFTTLDHNFAAAVTVLHSLRGRTIVTGMGKSGHIARKIAATLSSTGTPAIFVHPAEASHGDLGMITSDDAVIALSNSGETKELQDIISYTRRFGIPLIAIVRRQESVLVEAADIAFVLPAVPEACDVNAPTTSTTMMLALGDALAIVLLNKKGFSREDYHVLHPGGKLGAALLKVRDIMHTGDAIPIIGKDESMADVLLMITSKRFGCAGIVDDEGRLMGIITDGDLRRHMSDDLMHLTASEVMTRNPHTIRSNALAAEAVNIMNSYSITTLFAIDDCSIKGIIHIHDCLRAGVV
jgi:arabinose-5-phosphate isomerase